VSLQDTLDAVPHAGKGSGGIHKGKGMCFGVHCIFVGRRRRRCCGSSDGVGVPCGGGTEVGVGGRGGGGKEEEEGEEEGEPKVEQQPGVRYSLIFYSTESANATPRSLPVYDDWAPTAAEGNTTSNITADR